MGVVGLFGAFMAEGDCNGLVADVFDKITEGSRAGGAGGSSL